MDKIRIQIVNYKTKSYLLDCLASVVSDLKNFDVECSIAILDNASGDDLSDIPALFSESNIQVLKSGKNLSFGGGHNFLAAQESARYLLLLNPDIKVVEANTIARLLHHIETFNAQVLGPRLITKQKTTQWWDHGELHGLRAWIALNSGNSYWREQKKATEVAWVSGAVFLIEKKWFDDLSGFDERLFLYKEEEELCWRLRGKDGKVIYDPTITVFHHGGVVAKKSEHMQKSVDYFLDKHFRHHFGYRFFKLLNKIIH